MIQAAPPTTAPASRITALQLPRSNPASTVSAPSAKTAALSAMGAKMMLSGGISASSPATVATMLATPEMNSQERFVVDDIAEAAQSTASQSDVASCQ